MKTHFQRICFVIFYFSNMQIPLTFEITLNVFIKMRILQINIQFKAQMYVFAYAYHRI